MGRYNIDDILNRLGGNDEQDAAPRQLPRRSESDRRRPHSIDQAEHSFSQLPAAPANQRRVQTSDDPAVKEVPADAPMARVGEVVSELYHPDASDDEVTRQVGEVLVDRGAITREQLTAANQIVRQSPGRDLVEILISQGGDESAIQRAVAELAGVRFERIDLDKGLDGGFDGKLLQRLGSDYCKKNLVIPLRTEGSRVVIGTTNPNDVFQIDEIRRRLGVAGVKLVLVTAFDVRGAMEIIGETDTDDSDDLTDILSDVEESDVEVFKDTAEAVDLEARAGESPVIRYVNYIIQTAIKEGASDIHIEPGDKKLKVRFRIDGVLFEMMNPPASMAPAITSRLKIMANLDISERRIPQDGRIRCTVQGRKLDLRMSTLPTAVGEKTVLRILDTKSINVKLQDLGFSDQTFELWETQVTAPHGIVLVTGPTGSGKTTTLYSSLRQIDKNKLNVSTVEDPIEYHLDGITQTQTHEKIGMTFAIALRALLRQDPDVIMVGEIRDYDTALTAIQAALTGHLVFSTLHTNDAPSSITRLVNIGLEPFLVGAGINAVLAQRLVRRLCSHCKTQGAEGDEAREFLEMQGIDPDQTWSSQGCDKCRNTGYAGRLGIYELLVVDDQLRDTIARNPNVAEFRRLCLERGMISLRDDGMQKVAQGRTTFQEILRVTKDGL